jgi:hypothetical protein
MNVHLLAQSFAMQTGRRPFLCPEGVVEDSENWHLGRYATKGDVTVVAWIQLRYIYHTHRHLFNRLCSTSMVGEVAQGSSGLTPRDLSYYLKRVQEDLRMWYDRFREAQPTSIRASRLRCAYQSGLGDDCAW